MIVCLSDFYQEDSGFFSPPEALVFMPDFNSTSFQNLSISPPPPSGNPAACVLTPPRSFLFSSFPRKEPLFIRLAIKPPPGLRKYVSWRAFPLSKLFSPLFLRVKCFFFETNVPSRRFFSDTRSISQCSPIFFSPPPAPLPQDPPLANRCICCFFFFPFFHRFSKFYASRSTHQPPSFFLRAAPLPGPTSRGRLSPGAQFLFALFEIVSVSSSFFREPSFKG